MCAKKFYPNQYEFLGGRIFVAQNHPAASDENPGTSEKPFKTISAAAAGLKMADHVYIDSGVYREEIPLPVGGHPYVPNSQIHFHAVLGAEVYIKGSDVFTGRWESSGRGVWRAGLPAQLFATGAYTPYRLALAKDAERVVRPCDAGGGLPKTKGQLYVDGKPYRQKHSLDEVKETEDTYIISADGKSIIAHFGAADPSKCCIELTVRRHCIAPQFEGVVFIQTHGICIEHAAEPGPFCKDCPESLRENAQTTGIHVEKTFCLPGVAGANCTLIPSQVCYLSTEDNTLVASVLDDTQPVLMFHQESIDAVSTDAGKTWTLDEKTRTPFARRGKSYFLDESRNVLIRHWIDPVDAMGPRGAYGGSRHNVMLQFSRDGGKTWSQPKLLDDTKIYCLSIVSLNDGGYVLPYYTRDDAYPECVGESHKKIGTLLGHWNENESEILWTHGGCISVSPRESNCGLGEPSMVQLQNGKLISFLRAGAVVPSQDDPGVPSVKLVSTSEDGGRSWSHPVPLCYEDGKYVYSPRSYQMAFRSIKNGRIYLVLNSNDEPTIGCDPRTRLFLAEVDTQTFRVLRNGLTLIEAIHPEHHPLTRFSNFQLIQDRMSGNPIIFMKLDVSEYCPIWQGYDRNMYRYEVMLPE